MYHLVDHAFETSLQSVTEESALPFIEALQDTMESDDSYSNSVVCVECGDLVKMDDTRSEYRFNLFFKADEIEKIEEEEE